MQPPSQEVSLQLLDGWHCNHLFYRFDRSRLTTMNPAQIAGGCEQVIAILDPAAPDSPARLQTSVVSGHKADFGLMLLDPDPLKISTIHHRLMASCLGPAIVPTYSFTSITEVSEYVPTLEQYGNRLVEEGEQRDSPTYKAKLKAYENREEMMRKQRLTPDLPPWPSTCFYPMNKKRKVGENWFTLPVAERNKLMAEHGRSGMTFGGKVTQLITASTGFDDWEWGVTLWARNPQFLKDIVYTMRFDEASARYAEFGPFYVSYAMSPTDMLKHCRISQK
jgi:peroxiredoxin